MNQRREDLSTADLASQQPRDTTRPDLTEEEEADLARLDEDEAAPEDRVRDELAGDQAVTGDRAPAVEPDVEEVAAAEQEPAPAAGGEPAAERAPDAGTPGTTTAGPLLVADDAERFRARWTDVQNGFVDAPQQAVEQADGLVAELMQHLASTFADERGRLERQWDRGDEVSTDDLRTAFQRYRSFFERLLAT
jgi:hypothetical protein